VTADGPAELHIVSDATGETAVVEHGATTQRRLGCPALDVTELSTEVAFAIIGAVAERSGG